MHRGYENTSFNLARPGKPECWCNEKKPRDEEYCAKCADTLEALRAAGEPYRTEALREYNMKHNT